MTRVPPLRSTRLKSKLPPNVWFQGSQSTRIGSASSTKGQSWAMPSWLEHSIRCVLTTPLGRSVEPDVNRILAIVIGSDRLQGCLDSIGRGYGEKVFERREGPAGRVAAGHDLDPVPVECIERRLVARRVVDEDELGLKQLDDGAQLGEILAQAGIGGGDRRSRESDAHRAERDERMVDAVLGQDGDRPLRRQPAIQEGLADRANLRVSVGIGDGAPGRVRGGPLRSCRKTRVGARSAHRSSQTPMARAGSRGGKRGTQDQAAVGRPLDVCAGWRKARPPACGPVRCGALAMSRRDTCRHPCLLVRRCSLQLDRPSSRPVM
jgi:hypothetical protein